MIDYRLYIEGKQADVASDLPAMLNFCLDDIKDFSSRNTSFSKTIIMPGTARNNALLGNIFDISQSTLTDDTQPNISVNYNAAKMATVYIFNNNIQVFKGNLRLLAIVDTKGQIEYEVAVFGELTGLVSALGGALLSGNSDTTLDLDFSDYDLSWNATNIHNSWDDAGAGSGVVFPLIDYGGCSVNKHDWDFHACRPALYVKEYVDKIFEKAGFTYECTLFDTSRFKNLIIPYNRKEVYNDTTLVFKALLTSNTYTGLSSQLIHFTSVLLAGDFTASGTNSVFTNGGSDITGYINFTVNVTSVVGASAPPWYINILINGAVAAARPVLTTGTINFNANDITVLAGDYVSVEVQPPLSGSPSPSLSLDTGILTIYYQYAQPVPVNYNEVIQINSAVPKNILQKDFLVWIIKLFNLMVYDDSSKEKHVIIKPYIDYYDTNPANAKDWTYKIDHNKVKRIKPMSELNARYYKFKYKQDSDYYNDLYQKRYNAGYGDYNYDTAYEMADEENSLEIGFSATPIVGYAGEDKVYSTIFKKTNDTEETTDSNIRILQVKKVTGVTEWDIQNDGAILTSYTDYCYAGHLDDPDAPTNDLNFGIPAELFFVLVAGTLNVNQFNVYWSPYMAEITSKDSKLLSANFKLNPNDINNLDFSKLIWIHGNLFRLNKITDYNASNPDTCKVELLKVINTSY